MSLDFNVEPYYDDFSENKHFQRILFKPGVAVQARELTQLQTILQKQIERFGRHVFKEGAMVIPGQASIDTNAQYVKVGSISNTTLSALEDTLVYGSSGIVAKVIKTVAASGGDPNTLIVKYIESDSTNYTAATFAALEVLYSDKALTTQVATVGASSTTPLGRSSIAQIEEGVYFIGGNFVKVDAQTLVLDKYGNSPSYRIGLLIDEQLITATDDDSLNDNAIGSYNYAAPGADRYKISLTLSKLEIESELDQDFVELIRVSSGNVLAQVSKTEYSELEKTLARRTYDESGDYTVRSFQIQPREYRNNDRGNWNSSSVYYIQNDIVSYSGNTYVAIADHTSSATTPNAATTNWVLNNTPPYNRGVYVVSDAATGNEEWASNLAIGLDPGKAYVRGFEIEKIATEYLTVPKARSNATVTNDIIAAQVGNYVLVDNLSNAFDTESFASIDLYNRYTVSRGSAAGTKVGTARARYIELHSGTPGSESEIYKLSLFDISMNSGYSFERDVKQLVSGSATADLLPKTSEADLLRRGSISVSGTDVTGVGTNFLIALKVDDYIRANSQIMRISTVVSDTVATIASAPTYAVTGESYERIETQIYEPQNETLIYQLPQFAIKSVEDFTIKVLHRYNKTPSAGNVTIDVSDATQGGNISVATDFVSTNPTDYIAIDRTTGNVAPITSVVPSGSQITLTGLVGNGNAHSIYVPATKAISGTPKAKVLTSTSKTFTAAEAAAETLYLGKADVFIIDSIICNGNEIKGQFKLDDGQRHTHYGISSIIRSPNAPAPTASITVYFRYFEHNNTGDFFSVASYGIRYEDIPTFSYGGSTIKLSDCLDFRPRIGDNGASFLAGGASFSAMPVRDNGVQLDYTYYLPRKDKIAIDNAGNFFLVQGVPAIQPADPADPSVAMVLYKLELQPYTTNENDMHVRFIDNKRYTMRDIGRLEKRIENIEYYTALSLLEQETKAFTILDENNLDRYKAGFLVDNFEGHGVGDVTNPDYLCSIDMENNELRPFARVDSFNLIPTSLSGVVATGDLLTLDYSHTSFIEQPYASTTENVNPYNVFTFIGDLRLHPTTDEWFEVDRRPDLIVNEEGNFDSIVATLESQGVLGTVWNSWQTQWSGTPVTTGTTTRRLTQSAGWPIRDITTEFLAQSVGQSRAGVRTSVVARTDHRVVEDRILSTAAIPFIRSRAVAFVSRGMKPNTRFYPFFEGTDISEYVVPATKVTISSATGAFDTVTNAGVDSEETARRMNGESQTALNRGDVISSGANTAVVIHADTSNLYVINISGTIESGQLITGSLSGSNATVTAVSTHALGDSLNSTAIGDVTGVFLIPNTDALRFRTGIREFKLSSSASNVDKYNSWASARYTATGILETRQTSIAAVRNADIVVQNVSESRTITNTWSRVIQDTGWYDPLAQTFLVEQEGGAFLTKVDLYFQAKDTMTNLPVRVEIRDVNNGYPGKGVLPFSRVVKAAADVNVSEDGTSATTFTFESPVYVENNTEYALVVLSDSNDYRVWIAQMGQLTVGGDRLISEQPYAGSLFKSQNASTWTAEQTQDLKFKLYRASFSSSGTATFSNDRLPLRKLPVNPLLTLSGNTLVKVFHPNHGFIAGDNVTLSSVSSTLSSANISSNNINKIHTVGNVFLDYYTISTANVANVSTLTGGSNVWATTNREFDAIQPLIQFQDFSDTTLTHYVRTTDKASQTLDSTVGIAVVPNSTNFFDESKVVLSPDNDNSTKTFLMTSYFGTVVENLSPVMDINRTSVVTIKNKVNNPTNSNYNISLFDTKVWLTGNTKVSFSNTTIYSNVTAVANVLKTLNPGRELTISGASNPGNNTTVIISSVDRSTGNITISSNVLTANANGGSVTLTTSEGYVSEIAASGGSIMSKYITKRVNLKTPATVLKIMFAASVPPAANIHVFYKTLPAGSYATMADTEYKQANVNIVKTLDESKFTDIEVDITNIPLFSSMLVKLAFTSTNSAYVPVVRDFRVIACA